MIHATEKNRRGGGSAFLITNEAVIACHKQIMDYIIASAVLSPLAVGFCCGGIGLRHALLF